MRKQQFPIIVATAGYRECPVPLNILCILFLVQVAQRFEKKNAQDTKAGILYHCLICRKKSCKKIPEYDKWFNKDQTAHNREDQTYPQDFSASVKLPGRVILAGKGGSCLTESSNHVIGKIFKVHGNGTACNCRRAKAVHRGLYKDIGKAEYSTLDGRRDSHFKNCTYRSGIKITFMKCKWKRRSILFQAADQKERRKHGGQNCSSGNSGNAKLKEYHKYNI